MAMPSISYDPIKAEEIEAERLHLSKALPTDVGGDTLPFVQLGGTRFEILAFLLRRATALAEEQVTLVKSSGDRGRDVLVYKDSALTEIVQCKNQADRMTAPDVVREILKIALHCYVDPTLIPDGIPVTLSIWCTAGFTEPAAKLIDGWRRESKAPLLSERFNEVREKFAAFSSLSWRVVRKRVVDFASLLRITKEDGISLTPRIRSHSDICRQFFTAYNVLAIDDAKKLVQEFMEDGAWQKMSNTEVRGIADRILSFADDRRLYFGNAHVFGLSAEFLADMSVEQRDAFFRKVTEPILTNAAFVMTVALAKSSTICEKFLPRAQYKNKAFPYALKKCILNRALHQCLMIFSPRELHPVFAKSSASASSLASSDLWYVLDGICVGTWESYQRVLAPDFDLPITERPTKAERIAEIRDILTPYADRVSFVDSLKDDCRSNLALIREAVLTMEAYLPSDFAIFFDARSGLFDQSLLHSLRRTLQAVPASGSTGKPHKNEPK